MAMAFSPTSVQRDHDEKTSSTSPEISLAEILSALSFALDLTEGAIPGHAVRTTLIGMRIARALGLSQSEQSALYYALQLKDVGCSSNAARMSQIFAGDDRVAKAMTKTSDWSGLFAAATLKGDPASCFEDLRAGARAIPSNARALWSTVLPGANITTKVRHILELNRNTEANTRELISLRCDRGAAILKKLEMGETACESVRRLDERWDGSGYPDGLSGQQIPLLARITAVAQNLDVFALTIGMQQAVRVVGRRSGTWFDPGVVSTLEVLHRTGDLWQGCEPHATSETTIRRVIEESPDLPKRLRTDQVDTICEMFADVVDAKSPFTFRHSMGVFEVAKALAEELQMDPQAKELLQRGALLHDLGKLGVSNLILDKPGKLTDEERKVIWQHPGNGRTILSRIAGFEGIARLAGEHHEKLDGSGYPDGISGEQLSATSRLITVADCFAALIESRPYRADMSVESALGILRQDVPSKFDPVVFEALENVVSRWNGTTPHVFRTAAVC